MKHILHVSGTYKGDGSTISALMLHKYLNNNGYVSSIAYLSPGNGKDIYYLNDDNFSKIKFFFLSKLNSLLVRFFKKNQSFAFFNNFIDSGLEKIINKTNPDIIHFHWMPRTINLEKILNLNQKIIWTIRDFWAFTGGCNVPVSCNKFKKQCYNCTHLAGNFDKDLSYYNFLNKKRIYKKIKDTTLVFPCSDFKKMQKNSILKIFKKSEIIPNAIKYNKIKFNKINTNKKNNFTILFGAQNLDQEWKGTNIMIKLIEKFANQNINFVIFGKTKKYLDLFKNKSKVKYLGYISSEIKMRKVFTDSNLFIFPSYYESFGKLIVESLSNGVPVVANKAFGAKDIISHKSDGFLVENQKFSDYVKGINYFKNKKRKLIWKRCMNKSQKYKIEIIGKRYSNIYQKL